MSLLYVFLSTFISFTSFSICYSFLSSFIFVSARRPELFRGMAIQSLLLLSPKMALAPAWFGIWRCGRYYSCT
ncbi:hypothetical protein V1522DRAFT_405703 [Lipomyces starkeyi]